MLWLLGTGSDGKNPQHFWSIHVALPSLFSSWSPGTSLAPCYRKADNTMLWLCDDDSVLDLNMKQCTELPLLSSSFLVLLTVSFLCPCYSSAPSLFRVPTQGWYGQGGTKLGTHFPSWQFQEGGQENSLAWLLLPFLIILTLLLS